MTYPYRHFGIFRLLLAMMVMLQHFTAGAAPPGFTVLAQPYEPGSLAVLVFFCLSGFVIAEVADITYRNRPMAFLANRCLRICPHFIAAMLLSILLHALFFAMGNLHIERFAPPMPPGSFSPANILLNFVSFLPVTERAVTYNFLPIVWAIRIEMTFYAAIFASLWLSNRLRRDAGKIALIVLALFVPLFALSVCKKAPPMFGFVPYFSYGAALYFALNGKRAGLFTAIASLPAMAWHFLSLPLYHPTVGFERAVSVQALILTALIAAMTLLAARRFAHGKRLDQRIGTFTYPLYMYHYTVLIAVTALFAPGWLPFILGMAAALAFSILMARLLDPIIDRYRDSVRGAKVSEVKE